MNNAVVISGGNQYLVKKGDLIWVDRVNADVDSEIKLETLLKIDKDKLELGSPFITSKVSAKVKAHAKADKVRISRFKAKSRYDKTRGFRHALTQLEILD